MQQWHAVGPVDGIPDGVLHPVVVGGDLVLVLRRGDLLQAFSAFCPHKATGLEGGTVVDGRLRCPLHEAGFDLASGDPMPDQRWAGKLPVYATRVRERVAEVLV